MNIAFTTTVEALRVRPTFSGLTNVVSAVDWRVTGTLEGVSVSVSGTAEVGGPDPANFIDVPNLTEATVLGWIGPQDTSINRNYIEGELFRALDSVVQVVTPPWS